MATQLAGVERLADELSPADQARLIEFLAPRLAAAIGDWPSSSKAVITRDVTDAASERSKAWKRFRAVGDRLAAGSRPAESMTDVVSDMRR